VCDLETSRMGAPYIYDISHLRVNVLPASFPKFRWLEWQDDRSPPTRIYS